MAGSLNKVLLIGHLGANPEIRKTADGRPVASFSLATSERWKDKATGEKRERTECHRIVIFNDALVDVAEKYLKKGSAVYIEGQLGTRKWKDNAGVERYATEIVLSAFRASLVMLDRAERVPSAEGETYYGTSQASGTSADAKPPINDEIPF
jgi:single-strand DNA-binding protein